MGRIEIPAIKLELTLRSGDRIALGGGRVKAASLSARKQRTAPDNKFESGEIPTGDSRCATLLGDK